MIFGDRCSLNRTITPNTAIPIEIGQKKPGVSLRGLMAIRVTTVAKKTQHLRNEGRDCGTNFLFSAPQGLPIIQILQRTESISYLRRNQVMTCCANKIGW